MQEKWLEVPGYNGRYLVSDMGRVKTVGGKRFKNSEHIMRPTKQNSGYYTVKLFRNGAHDTRTVHRLVLETFTGPRKAMDVNHKNGDKKDNRLENLEWCSHLENVRHAFKTHLRKDVKIVTAIKNGVSVATEDNSRMLATKLKNMGNFPDTSVETIARSIRKKVDSGEMYYGYIFVSIKNL